MHDAETLQSAPLEPASPAETALEGEGVVNRPQYAPRPGRERDQPQPKVRALGVQVDDVVMPTAQQAIHVQEEERRLRERNVMDSEAGRLELGSHWPDAVARAQSVTRAAPLEEFGARRKKHRLRPRPVDFREHMQNAQRISIPIGGVPRRFRPHVSHAITLRIQKR